MGNEARQATDVVVTVADVAKTFGSTRALKGVDLEVRRGEIHALVGGNGSGKSTLIKILTGVYQADRGGSIAINGVVRDAARSTPEEARADGIHAVHQDLGVFADMSVMENMALGYGYETGWGHRIRWRSQRRRTLELLERFEIVAKPETPLRALSRAVRTQVAIARALQAEEHGSGGLLILDEPTSSLPAHEVGLVIEILRRYAADGQAFLYVSHRLDEVLELADRVTVLRDGEKVGTYEAGALDEEKLIRLILGKQVSRVFPSMPEVPKGSPALAVKGLSAGPLADVTMSAQPGEVVGIGGLLGSGRTELLRAIFGDLDRRSGEIYLGGAEFSPRGPAQAMDAGVAYVPEDRAADAAFSDLSVATNISIANISDYWRRGHIAYRSIRHDARRVMDEFLVKASSESGLLVTLSGGNQQKVVLARWLRRQPRLLLLDEPTQGVDVGARAEIYGLIREAIADGATALIVASDFEELAHVSDRVIMLREGRIVGELKPPELTVEALTRAANRKG